MKKFLVSGVAALAIAIGAASANAAPVIYNDTIPAGSAAFDATIVGAGGTVILDTLSGLASGASSWSRTGYTITSTDGSGRFIDTSYLPVGTNGAGAAIGGDAIGINPASPASGSGLTFTFASPVNAFGLEVGDWATCCYLPSSLYISFDGGATRLVASATSSSDNPGYAAGLGYRNFVAGIDDTSTFSTVTFYGDGFGEYLVAGGTIRYATVDIGSVDGAIPEPEAWLLMIAGFGLVGGALRRRNAMEKAIA